MTHATPAAAHLDAASSREPHAGAQDAGAVVMTFGERSVADVEGVREVAHTLARARDSGHAVVGVLAAMGETTSELLELAHEVSVRPDERELDMLVSVGERAACALTAMVLVDLGYEAISLTGSQAGIVTDAVHGGARIVEVRARRVREALDRGAVVLVAGFQGVSTDGEVTTLGAGGREATAVALAVALQAVVCEIRTDFAVIRSADPQVVPGARVLEAVSHDELLELEPSGAGALPLRSVELARDHAMRLHVRSSSSDVHGTWVVKEDDERMLERAIISGVVQRVDETLYRVDGVPPATLFSVLADAGINVDTILRTGDGLAFSAATDDAAATAAVLDGLSASWTADSELGQVSVVGAGMRSHPGVAATAFATLEEHGIDPVIVTTSPIRISCHVRRDAVERAARALHDAYGLADEEEGTDG